MVVNDLVIRIVTDEYAHGLRRKAATGGRSHVGDDDPPAARVGGHGRLGLAATVGQPTGPIRLPREEVADPDAASTDIRDLVGRDLDVRAAHAHLDAVVADVLDAAAGDVAAPFGVVEHECAGTSIPACSDEA